MNQTSQQRPESPEKQYGQPVTQTSPPAGQSSPSEVASAVKDKARDLASSAASKASEAWVSTKQGAQQAASAVTARAEDALEGITHFVSRHPIATFAAGAGLAYLCMRAMERSSIDFRGSRWRGFDGGRVPYGNWQGSASRTGERPSSGTFGNLGERAQDLASSVAERAGDAWESTRQGAQQMASAAAERAGQAWDMMSDWGKSYPLGTFLAGAAIGFGLAQLCGSQGLFNFGSSGSRPRSSETESYYRTSGGRF